MADDYDQLPTWVVGEYVRHDIQAVLKHLENPGANLEFYRWQMVEKLAHAITALDHVAFEIAVAPGVAELVHRAAAASGE